MVELNSKDMSNKYIIHCAVPNCTNYRGGAFSLFKLPQTPKNLRENWITFLNKAGININGKPEGFSHIFICQQHFPESNILKSEKRSVLQKNSVPIFINPPENLLNKQIGSQNNANDDVDSYISVKVNIRDILIHISFVK